MFSPIRGFRTSTDYKAELSNALLAQGKGMYHLADEKTFLFHTPYLKLMSTSGHWDKSEKNAGTAALHVALVFNCKVEPNAVSKLLHMVMKGDDKKDLMNSGNKNYEVTSSSAGETITA